LPNSSVNWATKVLAVTAKDIKSEFRTRYAVNSVIMFALVTLTIISISVGAFRLRPELSAALFWVILFFASMSGLAHVFVKEEESGTAMVLKLSADGLIIFFGKFLFNVLLLVLITIFVVPLFIILLNIYPANWILFIFCLTMGLIGLSGATTIVAAIVSKATVKGSLLTVLAFPLLLPLFLGVIEITKVAFTGGGFADVSAPVQLLIAYDIVMITISTMLFDFVWRQ